MSPTYLFGTFYIDHLKLCVSHAEVRCPLYIGLYSVNISYTCTQVRTEKIGILVLSDERLIDKRLSRRKEENDCNYMHCISMIVPYKVQWICLEETLKNVVHNSMSHDIIVKGGSKMERKPSSVVNNPRFTVIVFYC